MDNYIGVRFKASAEQSEILSALLLSMDYEGVEEGEKESIAFIKEANFNEQELQAVFSQCNISYELSTVAQQNWNAEWESSFEPVQVDDFALIRAFFHEARAGVEHDIIITPKMSFGTGHHATTYLMIQLMRDLDFSNRTVIDFGTGTAVLAILAEKLGAAAVLGIDNDEWSINNGEENIAANHCSHIELVMADQMLNRGKADIILANINLNVIIANLDEIAGACKPGALVLFSGLMTADETIISRKVSAAGFDIKQVVHRNGWIALQTSFL